MNLIDTAILVVLVLFLAKGLLRGMLKELCSLVGLIAGALLAFYYYAPLAELLAETLALPTGLCAVGAFMALFLSTLLFFSVLGYLLSRFVKAIKLAGVNRVLGGFFGLAQGMVLLAVVLFAMTLRPVPKPFPEVIEASRLAPPFVQLGEKVFRRSTRVWAQR